MTDIKKTCDECRRQMFSEGLTVINREPPTMMTLAITRGPGPSLDLCSYACVAAWAKKRAEIRA